MSPAYLPLGDNTGQIIAYAVVDAGDFDRFNAHRWCISNRRWGLVGRRTQGRWCYLHREVMGLERDDPRRVDHINRDTLDNRRANLRLATTAQNAQNQGSRGGSSRYRGVTWDKAREKWMASAMLGGKRHTIGRFDSEDEAGAAAAAWRARHMPFSAEAA
jgi:hypothetical protein